MQLLPSYPISFGGGIKRMLHDIYKRAKADFGIITTLPFGGQEPESEEEPKAVIVTYPGPGKTREVRISGAGDVSTFPLRITHAQRRAVARLLPDLTCRLLLDTANQRKLQFTLDEIRKIAQVRRATVSRASTGMERNSLRHVVEAAEKSIEDSQGSARIAASERLQQFKITLKEIEPPIWRRIQVKNCTLDKLHEHIQTSVGWTNSHSDWHMITDVFRAGFYFVFSRRRLKDYARRYWYEDRVDASDKGAGECAMNLPAREQDRGVVDDG